MNRNLLPKPLSYPAAILSKILAEFTGTVATFLPESWPDSTGIRNQNSN